MKCLAVSFAAGKRRSPRQKPLLRINKMFGLALETRLKLAGAIVNAAEVRGTYKIFPFSYGFYLK